MADLGGRHLVDVPWLASRVGADDLVVVDASLHLPATGRDAAAEFEERHIEGAVFFDIGAIANASSPLPHMLPPADQFAAAMESLGISSSTTVVAYDTVGLYSAARAWWMLRAMGHDDVAVLDGGLPRWSAEGFPATSEPSTSVLRSEFVAEIRLELIRDLPAVVEMVASCDEQIVDARAAERFAGTVPEPRDGLRAGHIPGSVNVPFPSLLAADGTLLPIPELRAVFRQHGVDPVGPVTATCGSGVTAAVVALALAVLGNDRVAVYDGSWAEWGAESSGTSVESATVSP